MQLTKFQTNSRGDIIEPELTDIDLCGVDIQTTVLRLRFIRYDFDCSIELSGVAAFQITELSLSNFSLTLSVLSADQLDDADRRYIKDLLEKRYSRERVEEVLKLFDEAKLQCILNDPGDGSAIVALFTEIQVFFDPKQTT